MWQSNFKEEVMRAFVAYLLALGLVAAPAMAATGSAGDKDKDNTAAKSSTTAAADNSTATDKDKDKDASTSASKSDPATPGKTAATSGLESELQQLRELLEAQSRQIQIQNEQMREQQERMESMEAELKVVTTPRDTSYEPAPDSRVPKTADGSAPAPNPRMADFSIGTADGQAADAENNPIAIRYKGITITPGGFLAAETVFRNKAISADINTPFNSVPFSGNPGGQTTEWNATGRQSRLSMLAEGKLASVKLTGYVETDFLGAGISSNDNESNSYVLRLRQGWGQAKFDSGFSITGGQMWSLVTETKKAVDNRTEALPLTIDPQYNVGFSWARQEALRVAQTFADGKLTLAASVEESNETLTVHGNPTVTTLGTAAGNQSDVTTTILTTTTFNNFLVGAPGLSGGLYNPTGTYAYNKTPDFVFKAALDPGWGHYEVFGVVGTFRDRVYPCFYANGGFTFPGSLPWTPSPTLTSPVPATPCTLTGSTNPTSGAFNSSSVGGGIGANARAPLGKHVDVGIHFLGGDGIGRYGTAGLPDETARPDGTLALLRSYQALGSVEFHATPKLDIYAYVGGEYAGRAAYTFVNPITGGTGHDGYGNPFTRNDGCSIETLPFAAPGASTNTTAVLGSNGFIPGALGNCGGDARNIIEGTIGFWYRVYSGPKGRFQWGPQYSYFVKNTWAGASGASGSAGTVGPHAIDNMVFTSFRYYLP
jgi:TolA-binding protein